MVLKTFSYVYHCLSLALATNYTTVLPLAVALSGCSQPPTVCGYVYVNETVGDVGGGLVGPEPDYARWSNDQHQLCYACDSCKAGVLASLKKSWRKVSVINIVILIILVISYVVGYAAFRNKLVIFL
ncbi:tetraspanin-3-like [Cucurbita pepo subsp. pepo]|uniref:tetraspanin-3-like n=1 Tax=Cucurbita pepo subsp. pepo TaxID=3664 RepID=UPI000C9D5129|nr:tetraspanin-3-like [Cucurbita pepo subsp. pepo]